MSIATGGWAVRRIPVSRGIFSAVVLLLVLAGGGSGCQTVQPWQRETFADYTMRPDRDPLHTAMAEHIYFSREASSGGRGVGGSGCGCN